MTSAPPPAITCSGAMSGPPGLIVDVEAFVLVEALVLGDVVAGELGLRDPFQLQRHRVGGECLAMPASEQRADAAPIRSLSSLFHSPVVQDLRPIQRTTDARRSTARSMSATTP